MLYYGDVKNIIKIDVCMYHFDPTYTQHFDYMLLYKRFLHFGSEWFVSLRRCLHVTAVVYLVPRQHSKQYVCT